MQIYTHYLLNEEGEVIHSIIVPAEKYVNHAHSINALLNTAPSIPQSKQLYAWEDSDPDWIFACMKPYKNIPSLIYKDWLWFSLDTNGGGINRAIPSKVQTALLLLSSPKDRRFSRRSNIFYVDP